MNTNVLSPVYVLPLMMGEPSPSEGAALLFPTF
jgi:hypothetical protein